MIAAAEAEVTHAEDPTLVRSLADRDDGSSPIVHLTYTLAGFDKVNYQPWAPIARGYHAGLDYVADLVDELRQRATDPRAAFAGSWSRPQFYFRQHT